MNDDLISRKEIIEAIRKSTEKYNYFMGMENYTDEDAIEAINTVPALQVISDVEWIPVSERLPEDTERYLVTLANGDIDIGWIRGDEYLWDLVDIDCEYFLSDKRYQVIAWMPLPKPYKKEDLELCNG